MKDGELHSWKEIASYLDTTIRTAQKWEIARGLPVRRMPGGRGRVLARVEDVEAWKQSLHTRNGLNATAEDTGSHPARRRLVYTLAGAGALLSVAVLAAFSWLARPGTPGDWRVEGSNLVILDASRRELWRWDSKRPEIQYLTRERNHQFQFIWIGDLDEDGDSEVLFSPVSTPPWPLICFDHRGNVKWEHHVDRRIRTKKEDFAPHYAVVNFLVAPMGTGQPNSIVAVAVHRHYPCQIALLDCMNGRVLREYWHSGYIGRYATAMAVRDLDGNGRSEIYLGGINNALGQATLVVLDPDSFEGASFEEDPDYWFCDLPPGRELGRVLFPRSCMHEGFSEIHSLGFDPEGFFVTSRERQEGVHIAALDYYLHPNLNLRKVSTATSFKVVHQLLEEKKVLDHSIGPEEEKSLARGIRVVRPSYELYRLSEQSNSLGR